MLAAGWHTLPAMDDSPRHSFYEFFAGGGMARLGLGDGWDCLFANDHDPKKEQSYSANFGADFGPGHFSGADVHALTAADLPGRADLAWASFPCQDLSLAGARAGLGAQSRSGAFFGFWRLMEALDDEGRAPRLIVLENVIGLLTSRGGADFAALCTLLASRNYRFGALEMDAAHFLPQSRPRVFVVAQKADAPLDGALSCAPEAPSVFHSAAVLRAAAALPSHARRNQVWWRLPAPPARTAVLADILEPEPADDLWFTPKETGKLLAMMAPLHRERIGALQASLREGPEGGSHVGAVYRRMRAVKGRKAQRAEARFDGLAGCLRTPGGGSSRQFLLHVEADRVRARRMSGREAARLMGLPDSYIIPPRETAAHYLAGDGVAVPCVAWLARGLLEPLLVRASRSVAA